MYCAVSDPTPYVCAVSHHSVHSSVRIFEGIKDKGGDEAYQFMLKELEPVIKELQVSLGYRLSVAQVMCSFPPLRSSVLHKMSRTALQTRRMDGKKSYVSL